jgi:hypothetical protein
MPAARFTLNRPPLDPCPDEEALAGLLDGCLDPQEGAAIAGHLIRCDTCCAVFVDSAEAAYTVVRRRRSSTPLN